MYKKSEKNKCYFWCSRVRSAHAPIHISSSYFFFIHINISCLIVHLLDSKTCNHFVSHFMKCRIRHFLFALLSFTHKMSFNALFYTYCVEFHVFKLIILLLLFITKKICHHFCGPVKFYSHNSCSMGFFFHTYVL